ncbi:MAG: hypothetical protein HXN88_03410 [Prevotella pallens]|nr:hypothetical protein [Prevotella pallens]
MERTPHSVENTYKLTREQIGKQANLLSYFANVEHSISKHPIRNPPLKANAPRH